MDQNPRSSPSMILVQKRILNRMCFLTAVHEETSAIVDFEFGDGVTDLLAELDACSSPSLASTSPQTSPLCIEEQKEDFHNLPLEKLSKDQFSKFMDEIKSILTFTLRILALLKVSSHTNHDLGRSLSNTVETLIKHYCLLVLDFRYI